MAWIFGSSQPPTSPPTPSPSPLMEKAWRDIKWGEDEIMRTCLKETKVRNAEVQSLRILVHGPVGAGKSSFINSINSIFQGRMTSAAIAEAVADRSFTKKFKIHNFRDDKTREFLPFLMCDIMGLEEEDSAGAHPDDLIKILKGQIKDGHKFNPVSPCSDTDPNFINNPTLGDMIHCLVSVIPAAKLGLLGEDDFKKMRTIRKRARIPQLTMLTKVDETCPEVKKDIRMIYRSKKIKEKMQQCNNGLGIPMNCIFPVKCYHEEIDLNPDVDVLLLSALTHILNLANDYVEDKKPPAPANMKNSGSDH